MNWFYSRSRNDQLALLLGMVLLSLYGLWFAVVDPLRNAVSEARLRAQAAQESLSEVRSLAQQLQSLRDNSQTPVAGVDSVSIPNLIDRSATSAGVIVTSIESSTDANSVSIRINQVYEANFYLWLRELEDSRQLRIEFLTMAPLAEPEQISASLRLRSLQAGDLR